jgi:hypothetical protein
MKDALQEVQGLPLQSPPELRLQQLLESLKDFCEEDELSFYQQQGFEYSASEGSARPRNLL